jgi:hypothetical protein
MRGWSSPTRSAAADRRSPSRTADSKYARQETADTVTSPVNKLRQIRSSLERQQDIDRCVSAVPGAGLRRLLYRRLGTSEGARFLTPQTGLGPPPARAKRTERRPLPLLGATIVLLAVSFALTAVYLRTGSVPSAVVAAAPLPAAAVAVASAAPAESLPVLPQAVQPQSVWLVEKGPGWEQYSNGLRIDTTFETSGDPRRYHVFTMPGGEMGPAQTEPVGLLFHTSESDIWPLDETNNERLRVSSQRLMQYIRRNRCYHYVIDRFGRVFRIVQEDAKANHAGNGVWTAGDQAYLSLNHAFLGICFETRWEGGQALPITEAQLSAGRSLTHYLRHRYKIAPEMCVTHGLTSVNPKKHLIGHHVDWARGFPFEAFGLPNQYEREAPSVGVFGFGYDEPFLSKVGEPWKGVRDAEKALGEEARAQGRTLEAIRGEKQAVYDKWIAEQARADEGGNAQRPIAPTPAGGPKDGRAVSWHIGEKKDERS